MIFKSITVKNFRNYKDITLDLTNKNIFFGMNDVGKTNFLYALRYVFDKDVRKNNLMDSDFHNKKTDEPIEITVAIDISDVKDIDCQKLRAKLKGALLSSHTIVYIKLSAEYDNNEMVALPTLYWGGDIDHLYEIKSRGYMYELDYIFNVIYIDAYVDIKGLFKRNVSKFVKNKNDKDKTTLANIQKTVDILNRHISSLSGIQDFEKRIIPEYKKFRDESVSVSIKSEISVNGLKSSIIPYIKQDDDDNLYPTAGEGRKKLLAYSIFDIIADDNSEKKINLFLIEEPENHLHKSMQIALSQILFSDEKYRYLFVTTHSPFILYEMNEVNLVRIYSERKVYSKSVFHRIPKDFEKNRQMLNRCLAEAIFADKVLLVEGPSEYALFNKVISVVHPFYESDGIYVLAVNGIGFEKYSSILNHLGIFTVIRTDNDLRRPRNNKTYSALGFSRCNNLIGSALLPSKRLKDDTIQTKRQLYDTNKVILDKIRINNHIFLSRVDLENDLDECIHFSLVKLFGADPVAYLQKSKNFHMVELVCKLKDSDCNTIYNHYNFACLKEVCE